MHDVLHGALHLDGKMWRTLPVLVFRPGKLTRRYIDGARARFVSPMALFLFSVFLMFAIFQVLGLSVSSDTDALDDIAGVEEAQADDTQSDPAVSSDGNDGARVLASDDSGSRAITYDGTGVSWIDDVVVEKWSKNPTLMLYKLQANAYKFSWLLIPLSLPFMWLLFFWKRRFKVYDHAIFVTYSLSFMTLLFVLLSIIGRIGVGAGWLTLAFLAIAPLHIYKQMRHAYTLSRFSAIWRLFVLFGFIVIILGLFFQSLFLLGLF